MIDVLVDILVDVYNSLVFLQSRLRNNVRDDLIIDVIDIGRFLYIETQ